jgi:hypothetical protein
MTVYILVKYLNFIIIISYHIKNTFLIDVFCKLYKKNTFPYNGSLE